MLLALTAKLCSKCAGKLCLRSATLSRTPSISIKPASGVSAPTRPAARAARMSASLRAEMASFASVAPASVEVSCLCMVLIAV